MPNPFDNAMYKMPWGRYAGHRIKRIPAQYFLDLEINGEALPDMQDWINRNRIVLKARAKEENHTGYTEQYKLEHAWK